MRRYLLPGLLALGLACTGPAGPVPVTRTPEDDVRYLASDTLGGRLIGSPGADSAGAYLARRFGEVGLTPLPGGWFQEFAVDSTSPAATHFGLAGARGRNVIGYLRGRDPARRGELVIIGAHYDHLGPGRFSALDPDQAGQTHNGADDNASGTSALIRIAAELGKAPPARSVLFIAFSGEEEGLLGSAWYVRHPRLSMDSVQAMVNLDMVGRLRNDRLIVYGTATAEEFPGLLDSLNATAGFELHAKGDGYGPSDQSSFFAAGKPVLHLFTDLHEDYHRASDDWDKLNYPGLDRVADFAASIVRALADRAAPLTFISAPPPAPVAAGNGSPGYGTYLGTIPDMTESPGGVRVTGVRAGSPAETAGLRAGDILIRLGDHPVSDLESMTVALRAHQPGDVVELVILRDGAEIHLTATLGSRGGR